jgi:outer membrane protein assembly factor BamB
MVYALDVKTGWVVWRFRMEKGSVCSPCWIEKMIFIGSADGNIYCLDWSGREAWKFHADHQVSGSPLVSNGFLYCGCADGILYCLDYRTGKIHKDVIYIGSLDHHLYAIIAT